MKMVLTFPDRVLWKIWKNENAPSHHPPSSVIGHLLNYFLASFATLVFSRTAASTRATRHTFHHECAIHADLYTLQALSLSPTPPLAWLAL